MTDPIRFAPEYELPHWPFVAPPELASEEVRRHPVVIVGAGLSGLTLACDLALRGVAAVVLDEDDTVGVRGASSRGICYAQKSLEVMARLGVYEHIRAKGVTWSVGHTFSGRERVYSFDLQTDSVSLQPPFVNLQQFYLEWFLVDRLHEVGVADLRWKHRVARIDAQADGVRVEVETPAGAYVLVADWLVDASGANSALRAQMQLDAHVARSDDRWCITDVRFAAELPHERWTWVDAPFNEGRAVWQHPMADGVWRLDYQMAADADPESVSRPEVAYARLREHLGPGVEFEFVWIGPYQYRDHLLDRFRHGRVLFIGDAAHVVCPFGARGGNTGIQDANNLAWKLALVARGEEDESLLDSYDAERRPAAVENLEVTSRTARFLAPRSHAERVLREAATGLAREHRFARALVNTGRMSVANDYPPSRWLPGGGVTVQNMALRFGDGRGSSIVELLAGRPRGVWFAFDAAVSPQPSDTVPVWRGGGRRPGIDDSGGALAAHLGVGAGPAVVHVRPDAYRAVASPR
jgi:3-(3-hydroxy-phenyl)propionate hydroxylase